MRFFNKQEDDFLSGNYLLIPAKRMAKILGRSEGTARQRMKILGLIVPGEITEKFKRESQFIKGHVSANKGLKQTDYLTPEQIKRTMATRFKKGVVPPNTKRDFFISVRADKRGVKYKFIRIGLSKWIPLHRYNWIQVNGKIPKGQKLIFKDRDTMNCDIKNLESLTSAELMKRNSYHNWPKPLAEMVQLRGALNRKINKKLKTLK